LEFRRVLFRSGRDDPRPLRLLQPRAGGDARAGGGDRAALDLAEPDRRRAHAARDARLAGGRAAVRTGETVLDVSGLTVGYMRRDGSLNEVVHDVSFSLQRGKILGLAGESGCGKSTSALAAIGHRAPGSRILGGASRP